MTITTKKIISIIQKNGPLTKNDLLELTDMKLTSLNRLLNPLFDLNYIVRSGYVNETGGRPSALIDVNENKWVIVGIDISRTYINIVLTTLKMKLVDQTIMYLDNIHSPEEIINKLCKRINAYQKKHASKVFLGIGIGMIGPIDKESGILLNLEPIPVDIPFKINIKKPLEIETGLDVVIESGANLALLAEHYFGDAKNYKNVAYINCGVGIRSSVMLSNNLVKTKNVREDTLAHMIVDYEGHLCNCGQRGCIDASSSIHSMLQQYKATESINDIQYIDFLAKAHAGDPTCLSILEHGAIILGIGIANYIKTLNLEYMILSGPLIQHSTYFYNKVISTALNHVHNSFSNGVLFNNGGSFKHNSMAIGGATYYFDHFINEI